jgi:hypothetical protein
MESHSLTLDEACAYLIRPPQGGFFLSGVHDGYSRTTHCAKGGETPEGLTENCLSAHRLRPTRRKEGR